MSDMGPVERMLSIEPAIRNDHQALADEILRLRQQLAELWERTLALEEYQHRLNCALGHTTKERDEAMEVARMYAADAYGSMSEDLWKKHNARDIEDYPWLEHPTATEHYPWPKKEPEHVPDSE